MFAAISLLAIAPPALAASPKDPQVEPTLPTARLSTRRSEPVVKEANEKKLGESILTTTAGFTLYSLSVEKHGKFTCTGSCLSVWHPLLVAPTVKPTGPVRLELIKRPDGSLQVTYGGHPLYTFDGDRAPGQARGEGIRDVGTWHAAAVPKHPR